MSVGLVGRTAIKAERLRPGEGAAFDVHAGQVVQIVALDGKQAASLVAFSGPDHREHLSVAQTRARNNSIMLELGGSLYSNRDNALLQVIEDTVKRHDLLHPLDSGASSDDDSSLASRLAENPRDADGWIQLIRSQMVLGQQGAAEVSLQSALAVFSDDPAQAAHISAAAAQAGVVLPSSNGAGE